MKKHIVAVLLVIVMCLATLSGCSIMRSFERDVQVTLIVNGETRGVHTVNIFNNAVVEAPSAADAPEGTKFFGWTAQENWAELEREEIVVAGNAGLIRYDDVKDYVKGDERSVTLYAAFLAPIPRDLVIAWYRAEGVSTATGLTEEIMQTFTEDMYTFLESRDYTPDEMDIVIRPYDANVGTSCGNIISDGDVNIMVGWGSNIGTTGGMEGKFIENVSGVQVGTVSRYAARLDNNYLTRLVFTWILNTYGGQQLEYPDPGEVIPEPEPEPEPEPGETDPEPTPTDLPKYTVNDEQFEIVIAWYEADASGMTEAIATEMETKLKADLVTMGLTSDKVTMEFRKYDGKVEPSCAKIMSDNDVDIMIGWNGSINTTGKMKQDDGTTYYHENIAANLKFGEKDGRYVTIISDNFITSLVSAWVQNNYGDGGVAWPEAYGYPPAEEEEEVIPKFPAPTEGVTEYKLVIGWYSKSDTSGLTLQIMTDFVAALGKHLTEAGYGGNGVKVTIELRDIGNGGVADVGEVVNGAGDYDMIFGLGVNITTKGKIEVKEGYRLDGVTMGTESRNIAIPASSENTFAVTVYNWLKGENNDGWLYTKEAQKVGIYMAA